MTKEGPFNDPGITPELIMSTLQNSGSITVTKLYEILCSQVPSLTRIQLATVVRDLALDGTLVLEDIRQTGSIGEYLQTWDRSLWFYLTLASSLATLLVIYISSIETSLLALRWGLGIVFVMFVPGYVAVQALFIRPINLIERFTLSLGMSLAIVSLVGLALDFSPLGVNDFSLIIFLTVLIVGLTFVALLRRFKH